jgi:predicted DNA-binding transcriptional regulator AlpA
MLQMHTDTIEPLLLDERAAYAMLSVSRATLWRFKSKLDTVKLGRSTRYTAASVRKLIDELPRVKPTTTP